MGTHPGVSASKVTSRPYKESLHIYEEPPTSGGPGSLEGPERLVPRAFPFPLGYWRLVSIMATVVSAGVLGTEERTRTPGAGGGGCWGPGLPGLEVKGPRVWNLGSRGYLLSRWSELTPSCYSSSNFQLPGRSQWPVLQSFAVKSVEGRMSWAPRCPEVSGY